MNQELKLHAKPKELLIGQELAGFGAIRKGMEAAEIEAVKRQVLKGGCRKGPKPAAG